ncbi:MAG: sugar ABC transporter ATP-binding protein [Aestuariivirga sp.]
MLRGITLVSRIQLKAISKSFPGVRALDTVDFDAAAGEIHALLGENGAGKSTLIKIMTGALQSDSGEIFLDGKPITITSPADARRQGINAVYQEVNLVPTMSVVANLTLGKQPRRYGLVDWSAAKEFARKRLKRLNIDINVDKMLGSFPIAIQQLIAIARALDDDTRVLVLDEPTASLDAAETKMLFTILRELKAQGLAIIFITHFLDQVFEISDRITVLRNGAAVGTTLTAKTDLHGVITMMIGRDLDHSTKRQHNPKSNKDQPILVAEGLGRRRTIAPFDLELRKGEVLGLSGLLGSGRTETAKLVFGAIKHDSGTLKFNGHPMTGNSTRQSLRSGIAFCPEERKAEGIFAELSVRENIIIGLQMKRGWLNLLSRAEQEKLSNEMVKALSIATPDIEKPIGQLSGGNQQKVVLARSLVSKPTVLILDEPTRGIDVGAHAEIINLILKLCKDGLALLVASSEIPELVAFSDRVMVLRDRKIVGELLGSEITREKIVQTIAGGN